MNTEWITDMDLLTFIVLAILALIMGVLFSLSR